MNDASAGDGGMEVAEELLQSFLFGFPVACSNYQEPAAAAAPSQILPLSFTPPRRRKFHHNPPQNTPPFSSTSSHPPKRSYSFPIFRSSSMHLNLTSLESSALDLDFDICQQQQQQQKKQQKQNLKQKQKEEEEIVELPIANQTRRSKSLRELFQADVRMPQSAKFSPTNYASSLFSSSLFSSKQNLSFDANTSSPISEPAMGRTTSSGRITLLELFNSDGEYSPPSGKARIKLKRRGRLPWKMKIQTIRAKSQQNQAHKSSLQALSSESNVELTSKKLQTEAFSEADASRIDTEDQSKLQRAALQDGDKLEKPQLPKLQRASSHCRKSAPISRDGGWGKTQVNPPAAHLLESSISFVRTGSIRATLARQVSTSSAHEQYYISRRTAGVRSRKRTYLPYREQLISFFCCIPEQSCSI